MNCSFEWTIWKSIVTSTEIYNDEEFLAQFCITHGTIQRHVELVKDSPYLGGRNSQKQSQHFVPELHLLVALEFLLLKEIYVLQKGYMTI